MSEDKRMDGIVVLGSGCGSLGQRLMNEINQKKSEGKRITSSDIERAIGIRHIKVKDLKPTMVQPFYPDYSRRNYKDFTKNAKRFLKGR